MKDKKDKRKNHESTIGKIIYGFLLFAPLLAILSTCLYAIFNKNANQSFTGTTQLDKKVNALEVVENQNLNDYVLLNENGFAKTYKQINMASQRHYYLQKTNETNIGFMTLYMNIDNTTLSNFIENTENYKSIMLTFPTTNVEKNLEIYLCNTNAENITWNNQTGFDENNNQIIRTLIDTNYIEFTHNNDELYFHSYAANQLNVLNSALNKSWNMLTTFTVIVDGSLDNVFYYSTEKVENSNLFNWSKNTAIYTVLNNTSNTLGITNTFWPMLMAYWLIISVIYILYDIVLMMLVIFHKKVHCLQDSI